MAIIPLPSIAKFDELKWTPQFRNQVNKSAWTGSRKVMGLPGGESFAVSCSPRPAFTEAAERLWRSFIVRLRGAENRFHVRAACDQFPAATANPTVVTANAGSGSAVLTGVPAGGLKDGMYMTFTLANADKQLVVITADAAATVPVTDPNRTVTFEPALRRNATGAVEIKNPYAEVAMVKDNTGWATAEGRFVVGFDAEEAIASGL